MGETKSIIDVVGVSIMTYTYDKPYELMEKLASNHHQMMYDRITRSNVPEVIQIDAFNPLSA